MITGGSVRRSKQREEKNRSINLSKRKEDRSNRNNGVLKEEVMMAAADKKKMVMAEVTETEGTGEGFKPD